MYHLAYSRVLSRVDDRYAKRHKWQGQTGLGINDYSVEERRRPIFIGTLYVAFCGIANRRGTLGLVAGRQHTRQLDNDQPVLQR